MAAIDVGPGATNRANNYAAGMVTSIDYNNPANDTGVLDVFEVFYYSNASGLKIGTFYGSSTTWTARDYESIGAVSSGSKQTFTGKNCDVSVNDCLGIYEASGNIEVTLSGYAGIGYYVGDAFGSGSNSYSTLSGDAMSIYATGATVAAGNPYYYYLNQ